jgi:hypothetical protein
MVDRTQAERKRNFPDPHGTADVKARARRGRLAPSRSGAALAAVLVSVQAEDPVRGEFHDTARAFLTYTPLKVKDAIARLPPLECVGEEEEALFREVESRLLLQRIIAG